MPKNRIAVREKRYQVWSSEWSNAYNRIPNRVLFGGRSWPTKQKAWAQWYDTNPGCNDHACVVEVIVPPDPSGVLS